MTQTKFRGGTPRPALAGLPKMNRKFLSNRFVSTLLLLFAVQAARAEAFVQIVNEVFSDSNSVTSLVCYNGGGSQGPDGLNCNPPGFVWQSSPFVGVTGTMDTTGTAVNAFETLVLASPTGETASASAQGDLTSGSVHSKSNGSTGAEGVTFVQIQDNVHFTVAGANGSTVTPIQITWTFDGTLSGPFLGFSGTPVSASSNLTLGGSVSAAEDVFGGPPTLTGVAQSGWVSFNYSSETPSLVQFTGVYDLTGASVTLPFSLALHTLGSNGDEADFSQTSQVGLILPSGVTYTSDSGAFLTAPVPEPSSLILIGLALLMTSMVRRTHRGPGNIHRV